MKKKQIEKLNYTHKIILKAIVTDKFKVEKNKEFQKELTQLQENIDALQTHINTYKDNASAVETLQNEQKKLSVQKLLIQRKAEELNVLSNGDHIEVGSIDGLFALKPGDNIKEKLGKVEVLYKDDIVKDIYTIL